jgi:hypothetical protein
MPENEEATPATEAQQDVAQASEGKAEASVELSEDDLEGVAGGTGYYPDGTPSGKK